MEKCLVVTNDYYFERIDDEMIVLPVSSEKVRNEKFFSIEGVGVDIIETLSKATSSEQLIGILLEKYNVKKEVLINDVSIFIKDLLEKNIIKEIEI